MRSPVPTGTVDLVTTTVPGRMNLRKLAHRVEDEGEIGVPVAAPGRRADRDEHGLGILDRALQIGRECQPPALGIGLDQPFQPRLPDRHQARIQAIDLRRILVDARHAVTEIRKAGARDEPHITGPDHRDAHACSLVFGSPLAALCEPEQGIQPNA